MATRFQQFDKSGMGYMKFQYGNMVGMDYNQIMAMSDPSFNKQFSGFRHDLKNANEEGTASSAHTGMNTLRHKGLEIESVESRAAKFTFDAFNDLDTKTNGLSTDILIGTAAVAALTVAAKALTVIFEAMAAIGTSEVAAEAVVTTSFIALAAPLAVILGGAAALMYSPNLNTGEDKKVAKWQADYLAKNPAHTGTTRGMRNNNPGNIRYGNFAKSHGAIGKDSSGFAIFPVMGDGEAAEQALLRSYVKNGHDTISKVISRWAPSAENDTAAYIHSVVAKMGIGADQRLNSANIPALSSAINKHENGAAYAPQITTTINVNGAQNPTVTAQAVQAAQTRVLQLAARNTAGVTR